MIGRDEEEMNLLKMIDKIRSDVRKWEIGGNGLKIKKYGEDLLIIGWNKYEKKNIVEWIDLNWELKRKMDKRLK